MASQYGINTITSVDAARPIPIQSSTPIGVVGTVLLPASSDGMDDISVEVFENIKADEHIFFGSSTKAKDFFDDLPGSLREAIDGIDDQNVQGPIIIKAIELTDENVANVPESFYDDAAIKSAVIEAINSMKTAKTAVGYEPDLLVAPRFSHDLDVSTELASVADKILSMGIVDLNAENESEAMLAIASYGTRRLLIRDPYVKVWDTLNNESKFEPQSARVAGMIAYTDGQWEYGFADSFSNRVMNGISGTKRLVEFNAGQDCEADRLRTAHVGSIIRYNGFRTWGGETTDIDSIWQDHTRVRIFDRACKAALDGLFWAIDRRADILKSVKDSVEQMLLGLKGAKVLLGFFVEWDAEKNTKANITAGKFYLKVGMQNIPIVKRIEVNFSYVDQYSSALMNIIG